MIKYLELIYYFIAFTSGATLSIYMIIIYLKHKNSYIGLFTLAYLGTGLLVLIYLINNFLNVIGIIKLFDYMSFIEVFSMSIIIWSASILILKVFYEGIKTVHTIIVFGLSLVPILLYSLWFLGMVKNNQITNLYYLYFIIFLIVDCLLFLIKYKKINHKSFRKFGIVIVLILSFFMIFFIIQAFVPKFTFDTFPLFYILITGYLIAFSWKQFIKEGINEILNMKNSFIEKHNITKREQEIIKLIQNGFTNSKISKELFVSEKTIANHIYNIYKKLNITSRFELICLFKK